MKHEEHSRATALDKMLAKLAREETVPREPARLPSGADPELVALSRVAEQARAVLAPPEPDPKFVANARIRLMNRLRLEVPAEVPTRTQLPLLNRISWRPAYALASLALAFTLIATSFGVVHAASDSLPGDPLYGVKLGTEQIRLALSTSEVGDLELLAAFAQTRLQEAEELIDQGRDQDLDRALEGYSHTVDRMTELVGEDRPEGGHGTYARVQEQLQRHIEALERARARAPEQAQPALMRAIERSRHSERVLEGRRSGRDPNEVAPGQSEEPQPGPGGPPGQDPERPTPGPPGERGRPQEHDRPEGGRPTQREQPTPDQGPPGDRGGGRP
jgi:hypothetical protein